MNNNIVIAGLVLLTFFAMGTCVLVEREAMKIQHKDNERLLDYLTSKSVFAPQIDTKDFEQARTPVKQKAVAQ